MFTAKTVVVIVALGAGGVAASSANTIERTPQSNLHRRHSCRSQAALRHRK
jgi:hypothetical protein